MSIEVVTREDLQAFRHQLLPDLKTLLSIKPKESKEWLRSREVRQMLHISSGTLQNLRVSGKLKSVKVAGTLFYRTADINNLLNYGE